MADSLIQANIQCELHEALGPCWQEATAEAANTGAIVFRVRSVRFCGTGAILTGIAPTAGLVASPDTGSPGRMEPQSAGKLHLVRRDAEGPDGDIGYVALRGPVLIPSATLEADEGGYCWAALMADLKRGTPAGQVRGRPCCAKCNRPISEVRLRALPGARFCINCQKDKEARQ